jgi:SAM-dependent methyltransferase
MSNELINKYGNFARRAILNPSWAARWIFNRLVMKPFRLFRAKRYDALNQIDTCGEMQADEIVGEYGLTTADIVKYQPVQVHVLDSLSPIFHGLGQEYDSFVDIGCGKGRACFYAAKYFRKVIGVDLSQTLVEKANSNLISFAGSRQNIEFKCSNAESFILPPSRCVVFLFNPFGASILKKFVVNNYELLSEKESVIIYCNDLHSDVLLDYGIGLIGRKNSLDTSIFAMRITDRLRDYIDHQGWHLRNNLKV